MVDKLEEDFLRNGVGPISEWKCEVGFCTVLFIDIFMNRQECHRNTSSVSETDDQKAEILPFHETPDASDHDDFCDESENSRKRSRSFEDAAPPAKRRRLDVKKEKSLASFVSKCYRDARSFALSCTRQSNGFRLGR